MPVRCIDHLPSCIYVWRVYTSTCIVTLVSLVIGVDMLNAKNVDRVEDCGNGFGWSIIHFDDEFYGNCYEFAVLRDGALCYDSGVTSDVVRGDWTLMDKLKCMVQDLHPDRLAS